MSPESYLVRYTMDPQSGRVYLEPVQGPAGDLLANVQAPSAPEDILDLPVMSAEAWAGPAAADRSGGDLVANRQQARGIYAERPDLELL